MLAVCLAMIDEPTNREKFTRIYVCFKVFMLKRAMLVLDNQALAEEAVQESFIRIAQNIDKVPYEDNTQTAAFLAIIVRNVALDIIKKESHKKIADSDFNSEDISLDTLSRVMSRESYKEIIDAVQSLDNMYSDVLMLKYVYGYDNDSIARFLKLPRKTVDTRIYRGKKMLQKKLEDKRNEY